MFKFSSANLDLRVSPSCNTSVEKDDHFDFTNPVIVLTHPVFAIAVSLPSPQDNLLGSLK